MATAVGPSCPPSDHRGAKLLAALGQKSNRAFAQQVLRRSKDSLPEWSKGVDSSSTSASCVGSNPTAVIFTAAEVAASAPLLASALAPNLEAEGEQQAENLRKIIKKCSNMEAKIMQTETNQEAN